MHSLMQDFRYSLRQLRRAPVFALAVMLTLAVGVGANTAIFSLLYQALLRSLPVEKPEQLVQLRFSGSAPGHTESEGGDTPEARAYFSYPMYRDLRDRCTAFNGLIGVQSVQAGVTWNNGSELVPAEIVSGNYFPVLGVRAAIGRVLSSSDDTLKDGNPVAVLSYNYWIRSFGADRGVLNQTISINGHPFTVVGVASSAFSSALWGTTPEIFVPMSMKDQITPAWDDLNDRRSQWLNIIGRLKPGETRKAAEASVNPIWYAIRSEEFKELKNQSPRARTAFLGNTRLMLLDGAKGFSPLRGAMQNPLLAVMGMVVLLLTMACVNTASLLLVRAAGRTSEFAMRYALGASRGRVLRQLLMEGVLLGLLGGLVGVLVAPDVVRVLAFWIADGRPQTPFSTLLDPTVLAFAAGATLLVSVLFSLAPAAQIWQPDLLEAMRRHGSTSSVGSLFFRRTCVTVQIGLSLLLLVGAGLFVRTIQNLRTVDTGIRLDHLITFQINPRFSGYSKERAESARLRVLELVGALPGVRSVAATSDPELAGDNTSGDFVIAGYAAKEDEDMTAELPFVTPGYFSTLGIPLLTGREFTDADSAASQRVAIVNEALARRYFGSPQNAIGRYVGRKEKQDERIVGVAMNSRHTNPRDAVTPTLIRPAQQMGAENGSPMGFAYYVRTMTMPEAAMNLVRKAIRDEDPKLVVNQLRTMEAQVDDTLTTERTIALLASSFGAIAMLLCAIGLYGVLAFVTAQRTREIGVRLALGAQPVSIARLVLREVLLLVAIGVAFAIPASLAFGKTLRSQLFNVSPLDAITYAAAIVVVAVVAVLAAALPAYRAATVDPMQALRTD